MTTPKKIFVAFIAAFTSCLVLQQADSLVSATAAHTGRGTLNPYGPLTFEHLILSSGDEENLSKGKPVMKELPNDGRIVMVQDVMAPKRAILHQVIDLPNYVGKVPKLLDCRLYYTKKNPDGSSTIRTKMVVNVIFGYKYEYCLDHTYFPAHDAMSWTLDPDKRSDFEDAVGIWKVDDHPEKAGWTRVFYACDIKLKVPAPTMVMNMLTKLNLKQAMQWSKRESESNPSLVLPADFDPEEFFAKRRESVAAESAEL